MSTIENKECRLSGLFCLIEYNTQKFFTFKNKWLGTLYRLIQLGILGYIIGTLVVEKKYQSTDEVSSSVTTKVKGVIYTNISDWPDVNIKDTTPYNRIWDVSDYVIPPQESDAFFVMTNMIITPDQQRGQCPEDPGIPDVACNPSANDCKKGDPVINGNGVRTGNCVPYHFPNGTTTDTCEIEAWCPVEYNVNPTNTTAILKDAERFTVLIKNTATYSKFNFFKRNILESSNTSYLKGCMYNKHSDPFCPVFKLGDIVTATGEDFNALAYSGGVIAISINWDCNLDWNDCTPTYKFKRLDNKNATLAEGYNFRFSNFYQDANGTDTRTLFKACGILFKVIVTGTAGRGDGVQAVQYLASCFSIFFLATVVCDILLCGGMRLYTWCCTNKRYVSVNCEEGTDEHECTRINNFIMRNLPARCIKEKKEADTEQECQKLKNILMRCLHALCNKKKDEVATDPEEHEDEKKKLFQERKQNTEYV